MYLYNVFVVVSKIFIKIKYILNISLNNSRRNLGKRFREYRLTIINHLY